MWNVIHYNVIKILKVKNIPKNYIIAFFTLFFRPKYLLNNFLIHLKVDRMQFQYDYEKVLKYK